MPRKKLRKSRAPCRQQGRKCTDIEKEKQANQGIAVFGDPLQDKAFGDENAEDKGGTWGS